MLLKSKKLHALYLSLIALLCLSTAMPSIAQDWGPGHGGQGGPQGGPIERSFRGGEHGRWWDNPHIAQQIGLTDDQKKKMDDIFQQHRLQLIDLRAALEKQEVQLRPMLEADQLDESKVLSQIDAIAQARADLEKANARMLFGIRKVLTPDQWKKLQTIVHEHMGARQGWGESGQGGWHGGRGPHGPDGATPPNGPPPPDAGGNPPPAE